MTQSSKAMLRALAGEAVSPPPIWLMRQAGRYLPEYRAIRSQVSGFLELCYTPELATEVTLQPIRRYGFDAAILFSDILVVPHALGQEVRFVEGEGPRLDPVRDAAGVDRLSLEAVRSDTSPLEPVYEAVARIREALPEETTLIGFAGAPWTVATYMVEGGTSRDFHTIKRWALGDPDGFQALIDKVVEGTIDHLSRQAEAGAEVVQLFDSHSGVLPDVAFERWVVEPTKRIVAALRQTRPDLPIIGFPRGAGLRCAAYADATGVTAIGLDSAASLAWAKTAVQSRVPVQGNLDPVYLLAGGDAMRAATDHILDSLSDGPFVFNLGHGVIKETPPEHVADLVAHIRKGRKAG